MHRMRTECELNACMSKFISLRNNVHICICISSPRMFHECAGPDTMTLNQMYHFEVSRISLEFRYRWTELYPTLTLILLKTIFLFPSSRSVCPKDLEHVSLYICSLSRKAVIAKMPPFPTLAAYFSSSKNGKNLECHLRDEVLRIGKTFRNSPLAKMGSMLVLHILHYCPF